MTGEFSEDAATDGNHGNSDAEEASTTGECNGGAATNGNHGNNNAEEASTTDATGYDPCLDDYAKSYYSKYDVQKALHVSEGHHIKNGSI